ncbi:MAG TPA: hypothetical protein PLN21_06475 [Gemmatales bacterium]|nr:hypothetical protein [Gemmatales bacterium]
MMFRILSLACLAIVISVTGCASSRIVQANPGSVIVAVPNQSNSWPGHYQDEALNTARQYMADPVLVSTQQVKVGETVTNNQDTNKRDLGNGKQKFGELTTKSSTTSVRDEYEYYLEFRPRAGSNPIQQTSATVPGTPNR